ncbi:MAG TPA: hypothetical protein VFX16_08760 [Pseudonocardiaceae bacterium]|nr:hypothetical protein [Pseudonocardiaceae bacterium]
MRNRIRMSAAPVLTAGVAAVGLTLAAPAAHASITRQVFGEFCYGSPSVTVPECNAAGIADVHAGRFDFYRCVAQPRIDGMQIEELEGFLITG